MREQNVARRPQISDTATAARYRLVPLSTANNMISEVARVGDCATRRTAEVVEQSAVSGASPAPTHTLASPVLMLSCSHSASDVDPRVRVDEIGDEVRLSVPRVAVGERIRRQEGYVVPHTAVLHRAPPETMSGVLALRWRDGVRWGRPSVVDYTCSSTEAHFKQDREIQIRPDSVGSQIRIRRIWWFDVCVLCIYMATRTPCRTVGIV